MLKKILLIATLFIAVPAFAYMLYTDSNGDTRFSSDDFYATNDGIVIEKNKKKTQEFNSTFEGDVNKYDANNAIMRSKLNADSNSNVNKDTSSSSSSSSGSSSTQKKKKHKKTKFKAI